MKMLSIAFLISHFSFLISSCARMGSPDGGWYDDDPPRILATQPAEQATNVTGKKLTIFFDEFVKLENPSQNVIISPPQLETPEIAAKGKKIVVELKDTLVPNTTYTIDFSDAISDNNEGNPMGNYTFTFSTGEQIDTFEISGYVLEASNLEPVKGISVGLYADHADSAFRTKPMERIARTNGSGRFVIKGVAPGEYRVYALKDGDNDFRYTQKSEMIAFTRQTFKPYSAPDIRQDTIWRDSLHIDSIARVPYTHFYPDDIVLLAFQEQLTDRFLIKTERKDADHFTMFFTYGDSLLPVIKGLNFDADSAFIVEASPRKDTITYWLRDTALVNQDTLRMDITYQMTDTLGNLILHTDSTAEVLAKTPYAKRMKQLNKEKEEWQKTQEKKKKNEEPYDSIFPAKPLVPKYSIPSSMTPGSVITIEMPAPLAHLDTAAIHLYSKIDTLWYRAPFELARRDFTLRTYELRAEWRMATEYSLEVDSAAFTDIYGLVSNAYKQGLKVKSMDDFATLRLNVSGLQDTSIVVQLLDRSDKVVRQADVAADGSVKFDYVVPATYYVRAFVDRNGNKVWDTGCYDDDRQPEDVYYYQRAVEAKAKWDIKQQWNMTQQKRNLQKPAAIVKQKADKEKKKLKNRNLERARNLGIEYMKQSTQ
jgi:uncharacterized protein (DUF2141 family)